MEQRRIALAELHALVSRRQETGAPLLGAANWIAVELSVSQRRRLGDALAASYGHPVHLNVVIDPSVVGGISVQIGDELIDGTAATRLAAVRRKLAS